MCGVVIDDESARRNGGYLNENRAGTQLALAVVMGSGNARWAEVVLDSAPVAVVVISSENRIVYANARAGVALRMSASERVPANLGGAVRAVRERTCERARVELDAPAGASWRGWAWSIPGGAVVVSLRRSTTSRQRVAEVEARLQLSVRNARLAVLVADGMSNKAIAQHLSIAEGTVATRLWRLYRRLGIQNRAELAGMVAETISRNRASTSPL